MAASSAVSAVRSRMLLPKVPLIMFHDGTEGSAGSGGVVIPQLVDSSVPFVGSSYEKPTKLA